MAIKSALLSFELESIKGLTYAPGLDHEFGTKDLLPGEGIQPVVQKAFNRIRKCLTKSMLPMFKFGPTCLRNVDNFLHIGDVSINAEIVHTDNQRGRTCTIFTAKFHRLYPNKRYKITIDIEEMASTLIMNEDYGNMSNKLIEKFVQLLDKKFNLNQKIEYMPLIKRGRSDLPRYLVTSDDRILEYDFDNVLFHVQSDFQDVKVVHSPSLGNTLLLDNLQNLAEIDESYTFALMDRGSVDYKDKEILILGGGDGGLLYELLKEKPKFVTMAEIDPVVIEACQLHLRPFGTVLQNLESDHHKIIIDDCLKVLRNSVANGKKYDMIFNDLTDIPVCKREESLTAFEPSSIQKDNPWHFIESIFNLSLDCLKEDGLYMTHTTGIGNTASLKSFEDFLKNSRVKVNYKTRQACVPSFMEIWVFYTIMKADKK